MSRVIMFSGFCANVIVSGTGIYAFARGSSPTTSVSASPFTRYTTLPASANRVRTVIPCAYFSPYTGAVVRSSMDTAAIVFAPGK